MQLKSQSALPKYPDILHSTNSIHSLSFRVSCSEEYHINIFQHLRLALFEGRPQFVHLQSNLRIAKQFADLSRHMFFELNLPKLEHFLQKLMQKLDFLHNLTNNFENHLQQVQVD